jgi:anthranilate synthase component I
MDIEPDFGTFDARYRSGAPQVVSTRLVADLETPVSAFLKLGDARDHSFLLESVEGGAVRGRYSIIGFDPDLIWRATGDVAEINRQANDDPDSFEVCPEPTLASLRRLIDESRLDLPENLPPMSAGVFGYMGYDTVRLVEDLPDSKGDPLGLPDAILIRPSLMVIFDAVRDEITVVTPARPRAGISAKESYAAALARIESVTEALDWPLKSKARSGEWDAASPAPQSNTPRTDYLAMIEKAKNYITAGDIFQVVLSQRFEAPFELPPFALYRALRRVNPAPFLYYLNFGSFSVAGSSPEILVRTRAGEVTLRPIAGTRPRGESAAQDRAYAEELLADPKERAEHLMLLDLGRNDIGRVSKIGSVKVTQSFELEYYSQVMHIVSNVVGELDPAYDYIDALLAGFPAGTVSGAPKVRAMEIIDELEREGRGIYSGCVGYFSASGDMDTCIALRTAIVKDGKMYVQAGAGIVADSIPEAEHQECINKAKALFRAAEEAVRFSARTNR